jgi:hypothetical protein
MDDISLDVSALHQLNAEQKALLDTIDNLRMLGIGEFVDLPQIIVVGDQSSGKSSVLEAISRVRFPAKGGLCTRFATELVLRAAPQARIDVSIKGVAGRDVTEAQKRLRDAVGAGFTKDELPRIVEEAMKCSMQLQHSFITPLSSFYGFRLASTPERLHPSPGFLLLILSTILSYGKC